MLRVILYILGRLFVKKKKKNNIENNPYYVPFMNRMYERLFNNAFRAYENAKDPKFKAYWLRAIKIIEKRRTEFQLSNGSRIIN